MRLFDEKHYPLDEVKFFSGAAGVQCTWEFLQNLVFRDGILVIIHQTLNRSAKTAVFFHNKKLAFYYFKINHLPLENELKS